MSSTTGVPLHYVFSPLSVEERWALERFVSKVGALNGSSFAQSSTRLRATLIPGEMYLGGPAWQMGIDGPDEQAVKAAIGDFRQLYTDGNRASAAKVLKILKRSAYARETDAGKAMLDKLKELGKSLQERSKHDPRGKFLEEESFGVSVERSPHDILDTWFNGEYFHDDPTLAAQLAPGQGAAVDMMRMSLQMTMRDYLAYWTALRDLAIEVLRTPALRAAN